MTSSCRGKTSGNEFRDWHLLQIISSTNIETRGSIKERRLKQSRRRTAGCAIMQLFFFVSWSNEQWHAWILIAYFHVNLNSHSLAAFCQHINISSYLRQSKGNSALVLPSVMASKPSRQVLRWVGVKKKRFISKLTDDKTKLFKTVPAAIFTTFTALIGVYLCVCSCPVQS